MKKHLISFIITGLTLSLITSFSSIDTYAEDLQEKTAIVLGGGGSRGSYEIGVWKALRELGISYDIVTGSSIGSINAALMATDDYNTALSIWENISEDNVFADGFSEEDEKLLESLSSTNLQDLYILLSGCINGPKDVTPFVELLKNNLNIEKLLASNTIWGTYVIDLYGLKVKQITQNTVDAEDLGSYILASSSPYPVFPLVDIDGTSYMDGGYYDDLPIDLATELGATKMIVVDITPITTSSSKVTKDNITYIKPDWDLGSFLNFNHDQALKNIAYGYNDTMQKYGVYDGFKYTFNKDYSDRSSYGETLEKSMNPILYSTIRNSTDGSLSMNDYYLRCAEVSAETLNIDATKIYNIDELNNLILNNYNSNSTVQFILKNLKVGMPIYTSFAARYPAETVTAKYIYFLQNLY